VRSFKTSSEKLQDFKSEASSRRLQVRSFKTSSEKLQDFKSEASRLQVRSFKTSSQKLLDFKSEASSPNPYGLRMVVCIWHDACAYRHGMDMENIE